MRQGLEQVKTTQGRCCILSDAFHIIFRDIWPSYDSSVSTRTGAVIHNNDHDKARGRIRYTQILHLTDLWTLHLALDPTAQWLRTVRKLIAESRRVVASRSNNYPIVATVRTSAKNTNNKKSTPEIRKSEEVGVAARNGVDTQEAAQMTAKWSSKEISKTRSNVRTRNSHHLRKPPK